MSEFWARLILWIKTELPEILHILSMRLRLKEERKQEAEDLERDLEANKKLVEEANRGKSDIDIVDDAIRVGRKD